MVFGFPAARWSLGLRAHRTVPCSRGRCEPLAGNLAVRQPVSGHRWHSGSTRSTAPPFLVRGPSARGVRHATKSPAPLGAPLRAFPHITHAAAPAELPEPPGSPIHRSRLGPRRLGPFLRKGDVSRCGRGGVHPRLHLAAGLRPGVRPACASCSRKRPASGGLPAAPSPDLEPWCASSAHPSRPASSRPLPSGSRPSSPSLGWGGEKGHRLAATWLSSMLVRARRPASSCPVVHTKPCSTMLRPGHEPGKLLFSLFRSESDSELDLTVRFPRKSAQ